MKSLQQLVNESSQNAPVDVRVNGVILIPKNAPVVVVSNTKIDNTHVLTVIDQRNARSVDISFSSKADAVNAGWNII